MKFLRVLAITVSALLLVSTQSHAWYKGSPPSGINTALSGANIVSPEMFPFVNFLKTAVTGFSGLSSSFIYPSYLQNATNLPTGTIPSGKSLGYSVFIPSNYFGKHVFSMQGTTAAAGVNQGIQVGSAGAQGQIYSAGAGTSILGCNNGNVPPCYFSNNVFIGGTNPTITFDFSAPATNATNNGSGAVRLAIVNSNLGNGQQVTITNVVGSDGNGCGANGQWTLANVTGTTVDLSGSTFPGGCTYTSGGQLFLQISGQSLQTGIAWSSGTFSGVSSVVWCKQADYLADSSCNTTAGKTAWPSGFNDDFITNLAALKNHHIRFLDANNAVFGIPADWNGWPTSSAWSYYLLFGWYEMTNWFGSATGTNSYAVSCSSPCTYTLMGGSPADGDVFQFYIANANTSMSPTLTVTDANSVTSSAIPILAEDNYPFETVVGGTITAGDTIALRFNTTSLGGYTCLPGGTHTTSAYTVVGGDTTGNIQQQLAIIVQADTTLSAQPTVVVASNPFGGSGTFWIGNASNACTLTVTPVITGAATETVSIGTLAVAALTSNTIYSGVYNALQKGIMLNTRTGGGGHRPSWPWQVQVDLAKALTTKQGVNVGCWLQTNLLWSIASFTSFANYMAAHPCPGETIMELSNEIAITFNPESAQAPVLATSLGLGQDAVGYYNLRQRQLWPIAQSAFSGNPTNLITAAMYQLGSGGNSGELAGTPLCGTSSCSIWGNNNQAYQNIIGTNYNSAPNRPVDFMTVIGEAPYYQGGIINDNYGSSGSYGTWSATASVASNVLTVSAVSSGTIFWNQGISSCDGAYLKVPTQSDPTSFQLTGKVTTTLNGAYARNQPTWTLTSTAGLQVGMWVYNQTAGFQISIISSINSGANQITLATPAGRISIPASAGSNDTLVFGGLAGTYRLNSTTCAASSGTVTGGDVLGLQYAADNFNSLNSAIGSVQDAYDWMYVDTVWGVYNTINGGVQMLNDAYALIATTANTYGKKVWDYEGGFQGIPPSSSQATSMGLPSSSYGFTNQAENNGYIGNLVNSWKNNISFQNVETLRHNNEIARLPAGSMTMWYAFEGGASLPVWSLYAGDLYSTPYKSYNAIGCYNGNAGLC